GDETGAAAIKGGNRSSFRCYGREKRCRCYCHCDRRRGGCRHSRGAASRGIPSDPEAECRPTRADSRDQSEICPTLRGKEKSPLREVCRGGRFPQRQNQEVQD